MNEKNVKRKTVTPQEAAEIYTLNVRTLANERAKKCGCPYYLRGRRFFTLSRN